jgi:hypothetical protein
VADWRGRAGKHCRETHEAIVEQEQLDLAHVQADEPMDGSTLWSGGHLPRPALEAVAIVSARRKK